MSDVKPEPTSGETGAMAAGPAASGMSASNAPVTAAADVESPRLSPEQEETSPKPDPIKAAPKADAVKPEAPRPGGRIMVLPPGERAWSDGAAGAKAQATASEGSGKRRMSAMAAVVALAAVAGALGGAAATAGLGHMMAGNTTNPKDGALQAAVARIDSDIVALKASVDHTSKMAANQFNKTSDRLDRVEKAQAEPAAKLAKLSEAVDKLRAAPAPAAVAAAPARDVTGSVSHPAAAVAAKPEVGRLPEVKGWVLRDVEDGGALIEGRQGMYEVYAGDPIPGLGRVDAIRKQDGRWVVVTSKGLIVAR